MAGIGDGARLMRASFGVVRQHPGLLWFPVISTCCLAVTALFWIAQGSWLYEAQGKSLLFVPFVAAGLYALAFVGAFFSVALAGAAAEAIDTGTASVSDGFDVASMRLGDIAVWAAYSISVALAIGAVKSVKGLRLLGDAAQIAWSFATIYVVPLIAFEDLDAGSARRKSFSLAKENWRSESGGLGALRAALIVPGVLFYGAGRLLADGHVHSSAGKAVLGIVVVAGLAVMVAASVVRQVFAVELYRQATTVAAA
jgi:hypothetical protein